MDGLGVSERRACRVLGQSHATQCYLPQVRDEEDRLTRRIIALAAVYGRYGTPRLTALLRQEGWQVNHKRVERLWRREELKALQKQPKRGRLWLNDGSCVRLRPARRDHVWAYDFVHGRTHDGRAFQMLTLVDEFTRECLAIDVAAGVGRCVGTVVVVVRDSRRSGFCPQRQRSGIHGAGRTGLAEACRRQDALHRTRFAVEERIRGVVQREATR